MNSRAHLFNDDLNLGKLRVNVDRQSCESLARQGVKSMALLRIEIEIEHRQVLPNPLEGLDQRGRGKTSLRGCRSPFQHLLGKTQLCLVNIFNILDFYVHQRLFCSLRSGLHSQ